PRRPGRPPRARGADRPVLQRVRRPPAEDRRRGGRDPGRQGHSRRRPLQPLGARRRHGRRPAGRRHRDDHRRPNPVPQVRPGGGPRVSRLNTVGRPTAPNAVSGEIPATLTGGRGLLQDEHLLFETEGWGKTGVDLPKPATDGGDLGDLVRRDPIGLPGLSEPEAMRHYVRLSQKNHAIDLALYPLGSCTMKHNPRLNEKLARLPGFSDIHPLQPASTVQGALELIDQLAHWLKTLT